MAWTFSPRASEDTAACHDHVEESHNHHNHFHGHNENIEESSHNHSHTHANFNTEQSETRSPLLHKDNDEVKRQNMVMRRLKIASALCLTFLIVEVIGGYLAGSLAVLSDAAHLLADLASFAVAIAASYLSSLPSTDQHTFGLKRTESLAALFSMASLALVSVGLAVEAVRRLVNTPEAVDGRLMSGIAAIGVIVNVVLAFVLGEHHVHMPGSSHECHDHSGHDHSHGHSHNHAVEEENDNVPDGNYGSIPVVVHTDELPPPHEHKPPRNINLHAAYLHVLGDLALSVAVLIAGLVIWAKPDWQVVDPICTLFFCALVFYSTLGVLRSSISVLLEEVPPHLNWKQIHEEIEAVEGIRQVHDLHIWSISHGVPTLSVHCMAASDQSDSQKLLTEVYCVCQRHGIVHATVQIQCGGDTCISCSGKPYNPSTHTCR